MATMLAYASRGGVFLGRQTSAPTVAHTMRPRRRLRAYGFSQPSVLPQRLPVIITTASITGAGGIATGEAFGTPTVTRYQVATVTVGGSIPSAEAFGVPVVAGAGPGQVSGAGGISSAEAFGVPIFTATIPGGQSISGAGDIDSGEAFGVPVLTVQRPLTPAVSPAPSAAVAGITVLNGMTTPQLQAALVQAQMAYTQLLSGAKVASASYSQGDGARSVTYTQANLGDLTAFILMLQQQLGMVSRGRRPVRFNFR